MRFVYAILATAVAVIASSAEANGEKSKLVIGAETPLLTHSVSHLLTSDQNPVAA